MKYNDEDLERKPTAFHAAMLLAWTSGFTHDFGKFVHFFQKKLDSILPVADPIRHEWLSLQVVIGLRKGLSWKEAWQEPLLSIENSSLNQPLLTGRSAIDYLIATHHRLPTEEQASGYLNDCEYVRDRQCARRPVGAPDKALLRDVHSLLKAVDSLSNNADYWRAVATLSRIALIMADHSVSALDVSNQRDQGDNAKVHANTIRTENAQRIRNQSVDWHLRTVGERAADFTQKLLTMHFPGLSDDTLRTINTPSTHPRFAWQNSVAEMLLPSTGEPTLIFNMAGTGSGKTRANVRALVALNHGVRDCRIAVALNLRTLTLQTRDAFRDELGMSNTELACILGSKVAMQLHNASDDDENYTEEDFTVAPENSENPFSLPDWIKPFTKRSAHLEPLIGAPVAVCTTDYLTAAGEPDKQGHHALASLRLMHSDLILDEIDSYDPKSLIAVLRIIIAAAMWGRNVVVSSATLPTVIARAVFEAYACGHRMHSELSEKKDKWNYVLIDDSIKPRLSQAKSIEDFSLNYKARISLLTDTLTHLYRPAELQKVTDISTEGWRRAVVTAATRMHDRHAVNVDGIRVSVGLIRCANIKPAVELSQYISTSIPTARVCCYHSQHFAIQRYFIERNLDKLLTRKESEEKWIARLGLLDEVIEAIKSGNADLQLIVVATPVEEIGRDHDFDWAVIEPSSAQSIVQTSGRVNRHRLIKPEHPNIAILQFPFKYCIQGGKKKPIFCKPGLETRRHLYSSYDLDEVLNWDNITTIDARIRFENHKLAIWDDNSISKSLKVPMDRILGRGKHSAAWMSKKTYKDWPLRETDSREEIHQNIDGAYYKLEYVGHKRFKSVEQTVGKDLTVAPRVKNDWLVLTLEQQIHLCLSKGLTIEDGFSVSIPAGREGVTHDLSYGFYIRH